ncbi:MAG: hypothetical protein CL570_06765 [Alphaproteobacteria bacterium]|nr:hypothetical protein [Alphaproteobacteria bacterium]HCQ71445.1 hypothetical protein [Rhodospirillaceae bacterium]|tara:strand:- start:82068 stop:83081 length:1014 start_codon:yes stop_codon:yes gene_type:complete
MSDDLNAAQVLFLPITCGAVTLQEDARVLYLNARFQPDIQNALRHVSVDYMQFFKPYAAPLDGVGWQEVAAIKPDAYDAVFVNIPKNIEEARLFMQAGMRGLRSGGTLFCAAPNKAGGGRLQKMMQGLGAKHVDHESAQKCRVVYGRDFECVENVQEQGMLSPRPICDGAYQSMPGIYGWDKIDRGSAVLAEVLPERIKARRAADFGCGYGYLTRILVSRMEAPFKVYAIDADRRAVDMCAVNVPEVEAMWADIVSQSLPQNLDFIVMNPPFHEGKKANADIGKSFILRAAKSLRPGGALWMVANTHLPYEGTLSEAFKSHEKIVQKDGFKVFKAIA